MTDDCGQPVLGVVVRTLLVGNGGVEDIARDHWHLNVAFCGLCPMGFCLYPGRVIASGYSSVCFEINFSGRHRGFDGDLFNL